MSGANTSRGRKTLVGSSIAGTVDYAAPEQLGRRPGVPVGPYSDVYGWAKTLCYALFRTPTPNARHFKEAGVPDALRELLDACFDDEPRYRPQSFAEVKRRLEPLADDAVPARSAEPERVEPEEFGKFAVAKPKTTRRAARPKKAPALIWGGIVGAVLLVGLVLVVLATRSRPNADPPTVANAKSDEPVTKLPDNKAPKNPTTEPGRSDPKKTDPKPLGPTQPGEPSTVTQPSDAPLPNEPATAKPPDPAPAKGGAAEVFPRNWETKFHTGKAKPTYDSKSNILRLSYDFADATQLKDFTFADDVKLTVQKGVLTLKGGDRLAHVVRFKTLSVGVTVVFSGDVLEIPLRSSSGYWLYAGGGNDTHVDVCFGDRRDTFIAGKGLGRKAHGNGIPLTITEWFVGETKTGWRIGDQEISGQKRDAGPNAGNLILAAEKSPNQFTKLTVSGTVDLDWAKDFFAK
jgi:hypothetical protein